MNLRPLRENMPPTQPARNLMDRAHAVYAITRSLDRLGMSTWTHTMLSWLGHYDGLETRIPAGDDPVLKVRDLLACYMTQPKVAIGQLAVDLSQMEFLHHRAAWINDRARQRRHWMPLGHPWLDFIAHGEVDEELRIWWSEHPWPSSEEVRRHLLASYDRMNGLR